MVSPNLKHAVWETVINHCSAVCQSAKGFLLLSSSIVCVTQVAAYDFMLPVSINAVGAPTPTQTPVPPTPAPSNKNTIHNIINPKPIPVTIATPSKRVITTALRQPLKISDTNIQYKLTADYFECAVDGGANPSQLKVSRRLCAVTLFPLIKS